MQQRERGGASPPPTACAALLPAVDAGWCGMSILDLRICHYVGLHVCLVHAVCVVSVIVLMIDEGGRTLSSRLASVLKQGG